VTASIPPLNLSSNSLHNYQILLYLKTKNDGWIAVIYSTKLIRTLNSLFHTLWTEIVCVKSKSFLTLHYNPIRLHKYLVISTATNEVRVAPEKIVFISSDSNYSTLVLANDESRVLDLQLGQVEKLIES
jgi:hypothetical protein